MNEQLEKDLEKLKNASPLEMAKILQEMELHDRKSSQEIIDEVYKQFETGENIKDEVLKPVFTSVIDGLLEGTSGGRAARQKGLTASRVLDECENFSYDAEVYNGTDINAYTEYKNMNDYDDVNSNMSQEYNSGNRQKLYEDKTAMKKYKEERVMGEKVLVDEYTGKRNLYLEKNNPHKSYNDETHRQQAQPDHIVPLKQLHENLKSNYALDDSDIKKIANIDENLAVTSAKINQVKQDKSNREYIELMDEKGEPVDTLTKENMLKMQKDAEKATENKANEAIMQNLVGNGDVDSKTMNDAVDKFKAQNNGEAPTKEQRSQIENQLKKEKSLEIHSKNANNAANQAKDYAVGNLILFIVKPIYFEMSDIFKNGLVEGVNASSGANAIGIRFKRVKTYVVENAAAFLGDNLWEFVKGFVSSLIEGIISLFLGVFKQIFKIIKEGIKVIVQSFKILFGEESKNMTAAQKGDAIVKLLGGTIIALAGIGIESLLNRIGIGEPWSIILSTMLTGIATALFMYLLNKIDLFAVKAEKRRDRIIEIFDERIKDINEASESLNIIAIETLTKQKVKFEDISEKINAAVDFNSIGRINEGLYEMAEFMNVDLPYSNTDEFCDYLDSEDALSL